MIFDKVKWSVRMWLCWSVCPSARLSAFQFEPTCVWRFSACAGKPRAVCPAALWDRSVATLPAQRCSRQSDSALAGVFSASSVFEFSISQSKIRDRRWLTPRSSSYHSPQNTDRGDFFGGFCFSHDFPASKYYDVLCASTVGSSIEKALALFKISWI